VLRASEDFYRGRHRVADHRVQRRQRLYLYARLLARHIGKTYSGRPAVVAQEHAGRRSLKAANYVFSRPKDGSVIGTCRADQEISDITRLNLPLPYLTCSRAELQSIY